MESAKLHALWWALTGLVVGCLVWKLYAVIKAEPHAFPDSADYGVDVPYISRGLGTVSPFGVLT